MLTLSDGTQVEMRLSQAGIWEIQDHLITLREALGDDPAKYADPEALASLPAAQTRVAMAATQQLTLAYITVCARSWTRDEPITPEAILDLDVQDFNILASEALKLYRDAQEPAVPLGASIKTSVNSGGSSPGHTRPSTKTSRPK